MKMSKNFKQYNTQWAKLGYPKKPWYIKDCGCGEVAIANVIVETDKYKSDTPKTIQPWCKQFAAPNGDGTYWSAPPTMMAHYGLTECQEHQTMNPLWKELAKGNRVAIYLMSNRKAGSKGIKWTGSKHFICSTNYKYDKKTGKHWVYVKDSNSTSESRNGWVSYEDNLRNAVYKVWSGKLPAKAKPAPKKTVDEIAKEVLDGNWGNGDERVKRLKEAGYDPEAVQKKVNELLAPKEPTPQDKICAEAKKIADSGKYKYIKYDKSYAKKCGFCAPIKGKGSGGNCIAFAFHCWHVVLGSKCSFQVMTDQLYEKLLKVSAKEALEIVQNRIKLKDIKIIIDKNGISTSKLKKGDIIVYFNGSNYVHTALYLGDGKIADCTSGRKQSVKYGVKSYSKWKIKEAIRYTGSR